MKMFLKVFQYALKHKFRFVAGCLLALIASLSNAVSLTALRPIFDVLGNPEKPHFQLEFDEDEQKTLISHGYKSRLENLWRLTEYKASEELLLLEAEEKEFGLADSLGAMKTTLKLYVNEIFVEYKPIDLLTSIALWVLPIYFLKLLSTVGMVYFISSMGLLAVRDIRRELYDRSLQLPLSYFVKEKTGSLMSRIINDVHMISDAISNEVRTTVNNVFIVVVHLILLAFLDWQMIFVCFIGVPILLLPINHFAKRIKSLSTGEQENLALLNANLQETISGIRIIRAFQMEKYEKGRFNYANDYLYEKNFHNRLAHSISPAIVETATSFIVLGLLVYGGYKIIGGEMTSGSFFTFVFTLLVILSPIKQLAGFYNVINRTAAAGERIFEILEWPIGIKEIDKPKSIGQLEHGIEFNNVHFTYDETSTEVLTDINFKVPIGQTIAIVGSSGAGKSTLVDLIPRFYDPGKGSISFDGINIKELAVKDLRSKVGIVTQEIFLFNGSVAENISYGRTDITEKQIYEAAEMAYADEFVQQLPDKYDTSIGERGLMLSGGQRQRLSIARALLKNPEILVLDEATSALDTHSERLVQKALEGLMQNRTTFVIAHRLSTIFNADQILVLEKGKIVEFGKHDELLKKAGRYSELYELQFKDSV